MLNGKKKRSMLWEHGFIKTTAKQLYHNYTSKLKHIEQNLQKWSKLNVTLQGKINAFKIHALSKINYLIGSLSTPKWVIKDLEDIQYRFIWSNLKRKLKHNVLIANYNEGGLKLTDIPSYVKAQKVNWIKRFLVNDNNVSYLQEFIPELSINHYLMCPINPKHIIHPIPTFYRQVLAAWFELYKEPTTLKEVLSEVIWLNKNILVADNTIFYKKILQERNCLYSRYY